ncbi:MAG TPA: non-canonical purine NTP pyrophosphatase [Chloroflexota bacterium]|nr:non-canonical purine NTP pyrophosphatase [Chloroflexota bacterium]
MSSVHLVLATSNPGKVELFRQLCPEGWKLEAINPGYAELMAPVGYESAATAKANAVYRPASGQFALGHDCGFEFESLGWGPGPETASWLSEAAPNPFALLEPGSRARVVHCVALVGDGIASCALAVDNRTVVAPEATWDNTAALPLSSWVRGPARALERALAAAITKIGIASRGAT